MRRKFLVILTTAMLCPLASMGQGWNVELVGIVDSLFYAYDVAIQGNYGYVVSDVQGLTIIDISTSTAPQVIGYCDIIGSPKAITVSGNYAYIAAYEEGLRIINISNPAVPFEVGNYNTPGQSWEVVVEADYAYVADDDEGLRIINISNPTLPNEIGYYDTLICARGVAVDGNYAYVADDEGLCIVDISNLATPFRCGYCITEGIAHGVSIFGNYAFVADWYAGLRIINITNPSSPFECGDSGPEYAQKVTIYGNYIYVGAWINGLSILNITNPTSIYEVGNYNTVGYVFGLKASNNYIYVADFDYFEIFDCSQALSVDNSPFDLKPLTFYLLPCYPNPFNNETTITYTLPQDGEVSLKVFDLQGREVAALGTGHQALGTHSMVWNAEGMASGVYFIRLMVDGRWSMARKVVLMK